MKKKDYINILFGILFILVIFLLIIGFKGLYGSTVDWESQHFFIPEYFRTLFYSTHDLLPDFGFNIGAGQNIYYFAYYGFLNPIILISYLFPFINMMNYIIISEILLSMLSAYLIYKFIRNNGYQSKTALIGMFIYLCAAPILFHTHRHVMFVNYMYAVILSLMMVDYYFESGRRTLLCLSLFLIIMTSYFFSVSALFIIVLYGIYKYTKRYEVNIKTFFKEGFKFLLPVIISILLSCILLLPVLYCLLNGRDAKSSVDLLTLLKPNLSFGYLLYGTYTCGMTSLALIAIVNSLKKNSKYRLLSIFVLIMFMFLIINYILNGTLYLNGKVFIPLIPILVLLICEMLESKTFDLRLTFIFLVVMTLYNLLFNKLNNAIFYIDYLITMLILFISLKKEWITYIFIPLLVVFIIIANLNDTFVEKDAYVNSKENAIDYLVSKVLDEDKEFYRIGVRINTLQNINNIYNDEYYSLTLYSSTFNKKYNSFFYDVFNNNIEYRNRSITSLTNHKIFNDYMGIKYLITDEKVSDGYKLIYMKDGVGLYISDNYNSVGFVTYDYTNIDEYNKLSYPYNMYSIVSSVTSDKETTIENKIEKTDLKVEVIESDLDYELKDGIYKINTTKDKHLKLHTNIREDEILFIRFSMLYSMPCSENDTYITINGNVNKLTCSSWKYHNKNYTFDYMLENAEDLDVFISKGKYEIKDIEFYKLNKKDINTETDDFIIDRDKTKGDKIIGSVDAKNAGTLVLTIPYDKGFNVYIDGLKTDYRLVNDGLIGIDIEKGKHNVEIIYEAPLKKLGIICGIIGLVGLLYLKIGDVKLWKKSQL